MSAAALATILAAGLTVRPGEGHRLKVAPAGLLTDELRTLIQEHRSEIALSLRERTAFDTRVRCTDCANLARRNHCADHISADLTTPDLATHFVNLRQHCPGFTQRALVQADS